MCKKSYVNNVPTKRNVEDDDSQQEDFNCCSRNTLRIQTAVYSFLKTHTNLIKTVIKTVLLGVFFAYLGNIKQKKSSSILYKLLRYLPSNMKHHSFCIRSGTEWCKCVLLPSLNLCLEMIG
jgi:hypothetical protein